MENQSGHIAKGKAPGFNVKQMKQYLETSWLGHQISYFEELESTNLYLKQQPRDQISHGLLCLADHQLKGRGQYERNWESSANENLTFTIVFTPDKSERLHVLTLTTCLAMVETLENISDIGIKIKWPNDIVMNHQKVGGILTETVFTGNKLDRILVGVGVNINQVEFSQRLKEKATSVRAETGKLYDRESILAQFLNRLEYYYRLWKSMDADLIKSINRRMIGYGQWVTLFVNGNRRKGKWKLLGINESGELMMLGEDAEIETFCYEQIRIVTG